MNRLLCTAVRLSPRVVPQWQQSATYRSGVDDFGYSKPIHGRHDWTVMSKDGSTIVCWHPEVAFPYECSKPLPVVKNAQDGETLKVQLKEDLSYIRPKKYEKAMIEDLMKLTYTTKHRWFPRPYLKYRKPFVRQREGL